jgi:hypothetical protein
VTGTLPALLALIMAASALLLAPGQAHADKNELAKEKYNEGIEAFDAEKYEKALDAFISSYQMIPKPKKLLYIADCYAAMYDFAKAMKFYEKYRVEEGDALSSKEAEKLQTKIDRVSKQVGKLKVDEDDVEGELFVDDESYGYLPVKETIFLGAGSHVVTVEHKGDTVFEKKVVIESGETTKVTVVAEAEETPTAVVSDKGHDEDEEEDEEEEVKAPKSKKGTVKIETEGDETARVFFDGIEVGDTPWEDEFLPGEYKVEVKAPGLPAWKGKVVIEAGKTTTVEVGFEGSKKAPNPNNPMFWTSVGVFVPTVVAGIVLAINTKQRNDESAKLTKELDMGLYDSLPEEKAAVIQRQNDLVEFGKKDQIGAILSLAGAGVALAAGVASIFIFSKEARAAEADIEVSAVGPIVDPSTGTLGVGLTGSF